MISRAGLWDLKACLVAIAVSRREVSMDEGGRCFEVSVLPVSTAAQRCPRLLELFCARGICELSTEYERG